MSLFDRFGDWMLTKALGVTPAEAGSRAPARLCSYCRSPYWVQCSNCYINSLGQWVTEGCRPTNQWCV